MLRKTLKLDANAPEDAEITWLELFYDLVFVAAIIQLGNFLSHHLTLGGVLEFVFLFVILWGCWAGTAFFFNRCSVDSVTRRLLIFAQIFAIGNLAVVIGEAFGAASREFALTVAAVRLILVALYLLVYRDAPERRPLVGRYAAGFGVVAGLWLVSVFVPAPYRYALWVLALGLDFFTGLYLGTRSYRSLLPLNIPRLSERLGQFTLIVLGESFIKTVSGLTSEGISLESLAFSAAAFVFIASIWWTYFQDVAGTVIRRGAALAGAFWHIPLMMGITAMGVALQSVVLLEVGGVFDQPHRLLLYGAVALCFAAVAVIDLLTLERDGAGKRGKVIARLVAVGVFGLLMTVGLSLPTLTSLGLALLACAAQIAVEIRQNPQATTAARAVPVESRE